MHLRSSQLLQLEDILIELGLDPEALDWRNAVEHLPNSTLSVILEGGQSLYSQALGYFFTIGQPWHILRSPSGEDLISEAVGVGTWEDVTRVFRDWAGQLKREVEESPLWPSESGAESARAFLQRTQLNTLYRRLQDRGLPTDFGIWSTHKTWTRLQSSNYPFYFQLRRNPTTPGRGPFSVAYSPGPIVNTAKGDSLIWAGVVQHFQVWLDAVWEDLPAEQRLRAPAASRRQPQPGSGHCA